MYLFKTRNIRTIFRAYFMFHILHMICTYGIYLSYLWYFRSICCLNGQIFNIIHLLIFWVYQTRSFRDSAPESVHKVDLKTFDKFCWSQIPPNYRRFHLNLVIFRNFWSVSLFFENYCRKLWSIWSLGSDLFNDLINGSGCNLGLVLISFMSWI